MPLSECVHLPHHSWGVRTYPRKNGCGFTLTPGDGEALTERILALAGDRELYTSMGTRARVAFEGQWDKDQALAKWEALLRGVGEDPHRSLRG